MKFLTLCLSVFLALAASAGEVHNGKTPKKNHTLEFIEDLRIGNEDDDNYFWSGLSTSVAVNSKGHIFVTDTNEQRVMEYDAAGKFIKQIGQQGAGPGEFTALQSYQILGDDSAIAYELISSAFPKFSRFDAEGKFIDSQRISDMNKLMQSAVFSPDGKRVAALNVKLDQAAGKMTFISGIMSSEYEMLKELTTATKASFDPSRLQDPNYWAEFMGENMKALLGGTGMTAFGADGSVYTAISTNYEITKWSPDLKNKDMVITRKYRPVPYSEAEITALADNQAEVIKDAFPPQLAAFITPAVMQKAVELAEFPPVQHPLSSLMVMDNGMLLAVHETSAIKGSVVMDLFDQKGVYLGQATMGNNAVGQGMSQRGIQFHNGFAYVVERNEDDNMQVVRYKYKLTKK